MIYYGVCIGPSGKYDTFAKAGLARTIEPGSPVAESRDNTSICAAYNEILECFGAQPDLEALVLLHDDVELRDPFFNDKLRRRLAEPDVGIVGAIGANDVTSLAWWEGRAHGQVDETRGHIDFGLGAADVEAVDGLVLVLSPWAARHLRFDQASFPAFHGYDLDLCFQARRAGKRVVVEHFDLFHHTKGGYGDTKQYAIADTAFRRKWSPSPGPSRLGRSQREAVVPGAVRSPCTIVIPLYNNAGLTRRCLDTLAATTDLGSTELVLVDNASTDETPALLEEFGDRAVIIHNTANVGFARACNQGAEAASGEALMFLNSDTELWPGWLEPLHATLSAEPGVGAVGSKLVFADGTLQHAGVAIVEDRRVAALVPSHRFYRQPGNEPGANVVIDLQAVTAAAMLVRRDAFDQVGGFDPRYWNGYEDVDLCFKLRLAGWRIVYQPRSCLLHHGSATGPERFVKENENLARLCQRWEGKIVPDVVVRDGKMVAGALA